MTNLRLAFHIHSAFSDDCDWPIQRIIRQLRLLGYNGALVCEHDRTMTDQKWREVVAACRSVSESGFLLVPGIEYQDPAHVVHLPVYGDIPFLGRSPEVADVLAHSAAEGGVSVWAHPGRLSAYQAFDESWASQLDGIEVWNRKYDGIRPNPWALHVAEQFALKRFVGLDYHGPRQLFPLTVHVETRGPATVESAISAIHTRGVRPTALGVDPDRFLAGRLGTAVTTAERWRASAAPIVRRVEGAVRR